MKDLGDLSLIKKTASFIAVILVAVLGFIFYLGSPHHAVLEISDGYKKHSIDTVKKHVDIDELSNQIAEDVSDIARAEMEKKNQEATATAYGNWAAQISISISTSLLPYIEDQVRTGAKTVIIESIEGKESDNENLPIFGELTFKDILPGGRVKIENAGNEEVFLTIPNKKNENLIFRMRKVEGTWKIVRLENLEEFLKSYEE